MKRLQRSAVFLLICTLLLTGCGGYPYRHALDVPDDNCRTWYEVFVPSFYDSNGDGIGDLRGLTQKLDYLNDGKGGGLGVNGLWLMPIMPSPSYHKYDVTNYEAIDPAYGTLADFQQLIAACHQRGIRLIIDYELNHTSSQHPWFLAATAAIAAHPANPSSPYLGYYNFVRGQPSVGKYSPVGATGWYYEAEMSPSMPDLNLDSPRVRAEIQRFTKFWLGLGVDGFRLDAVLSYYGSGGSANDQNIAFVNWFSDDCRTLRPDVYIVGEVWSNASTIASYYSSHATSFFAFPFAQATGYVTEALISQGSDAGARAFCQTMADWQEMLHAYSSTAIDAPFIGNHDTARPAGFFSGDLDRTKMAAGLYLLMSGGPFIYYGEELGMTGSRTDQDKRGPMEWSAKEQAGMTKGPPGMDPPVYLFPAEDTQTGDPNSLLNYYRRAIELRNENPAIARGTVTVVNASTDPEIGVTARTWKGSRILVVYNTGATATTLLLDKATYAYTGIRGYLSATGRAVTLRGSQLRLPAFSIVILQ